MKKGMYLIVGVILVVVILAIVYFGRIPKQANATSIKRFENLPPKPSDFEAYTREIWSGAYTDLCELDERYWMQPAFYGTSWLIAKEKFYDNPDYGMWGVYGHGNIPRKISYTFENLKEGDTYELCSFFHNGFGVWTYQGFKLVPFGENEYFSIEITPNEFYLSPTFPVFEKGWNKKIYIKIIVKKTPPAGDYILGFDVVPPSNAFSREATKQVLQIDVDKDKYIEDCVTYLHDRIRCINLVSLRQKKYVEGGTYQTNVPPLTIDITVK